MSDFYDKLRSLCFIQKAIHLNKIHILDLYFRKCSSSQAEHVFWRKRHQLKCITVTP